MIATDFFSSNSYIILPTMKNPKVALAIDNSALAKNSFKLYNPFSQKAKNLKKVGVFAFVNFNGLSKTVWTTRKEKQSAFVSYLEMKLDRQLISSLYFSTIHDKVVMQLQTPDAEIIGYLKFPLNKVGLQHLKNEKKAIEILSEKKLVKKYLLYGEFNSKPFLLLATLDGEIDLVKRTHVDHLLLRFKREKSYLFSQHPRIVKLQESVSADDLSKYQSIIENICINSTLSYALVYEHGDFTPWNIVKVDERYVPFDLEHFVEDGLEYFDLIKYYYQIGRLLEGKNANDLVVFISEMINVKEIRELLQLFLIKEILQNREENESCDFEVNILEEITKQ